MKYFILSIAVAMSLSSVVVNAEEINRVAVKVSAQTVEYGDINNWVFAQGIVQGVRREYLSFEKPGKVTLIGKDATGRALRVGTKVNGPEQGKKLGQLIASIDERADSERFKLMEAGYFTAKLRITQAESQLVKAQNDLLLIQQDFQRVKSIWDKKLISRKQFDVVKTNLLNAQESLSVSEVELQAAKSQKVAALANLQQAKVALEKNSLYAPFDGVIRTMNIRQGDYFVGPAATLTDRQREASAAIVVVDTSEYEATLNIPSYMGTSIQEGQTVYLGQSSFMISQAADKDFPKDSITKAKVYSVSPSISIDKRAIQVKVRTEEKAELLQDGMYAYAWILTHVKHHALTVPMSALIMRDNIPYVFVINEQNIAELKKVELGILGRKSVEVVAGIQSGDQLITTGNHKLVNGTSVLVVKGQ